MLSFLKPIYDELKVLENSGKDIILTNKQKITCRAFLLGGTCDLPAK